MTIRFKLILLAIAAILVVNSLLSLAGVHYVDAVWMQEIQDRVRVSLNSAQLAYDSHEQRMVSFLQATAIDHILSVAVSQPSESAITQVMDRVQAAGHMDFVILLDRQGTVRYRPANPAQTGDSLARLPLVRQALQGGATVSGTLLLSGDELACEGPDLLQRARFRLLPTPAAGPTPEQERTDGLLMAAVVPIYDDQRSVVGLLLGGNLLNRRSELVDRIRRDVFVEHRPEENGLGTVTIFQGDLRIATNVLDDNGHRAVGTRMSVPVYKEVIERGNVWSAPAFVVNEWYITAYQPIRDPDKRVIGALYVGLPRAPYARQRNTIVAVFLSAVLVATVVTLAVLWLVTNWVLRPIHRVLEMCKRVIKGDLSARVGRRPPGEFGVLCQTLDDMAAAIQQREQDLHHVTRQQIGRSEKLASIGRLAAGIAHEINNPLTGVLTFAHLVRDRQEPGSQDREDVDLIIHETGRVAEVVQGLLDFARERPVTKRELDVNTVIQRMIRLVENQKEMRMIHIEQDYAEDLPGVLGDANQLQQVLLNLFLNAAAAMASGGILRVTTFADAGDVVIVVADSGCGIPPENLDKIFDPFFTTKPVGQGTGLGLSVSYGIIEQHGGGIEAESEWGAGSTFTIRLPAVPALTHGMLEETETS